MEVLDQLLHYILHIDDYLFYFVGAYGMWTYAVLFLIIFCETGLVICPFLPGDSLLFAAGSIAAHPTSTLRFEILFLLLCAASFLGNKLNYFIGRMIGPRIFYANDSWLLNKKHLQKTHDFYEKHGGKTIILARFLPIIRTFAPFVAGIGEMSIQRFFLYNLFSAILWISTLLGAGFFLGSLPIIKENFSIIIYAIILLSALPPFFVFLYGKLFSNG